MRVQVLEGRAGRSRPVRESLTLLGSLIVLLHTASGCLSYPDSDERLDDLIIYTHYDKEADFKAYKTFAISTEVVTFEEDDGEIVRDTLEGALAEPMLEQVEQQLIDRGYTKVTKDDAPDLGVTLSVLSGTVTSVYYDYWGSYWGYPYYPYYPYYYVYSYNTGTLVIDLADLKNAPPPDPADPILPPGDGIASKLDVPWTGLVYGVLSESKSENLDHALQGIDQAFKQSPYLKAE